MFRFIALGLVLSLVSNTFAADWPQWRGPNRDGKLTGVSPWPDSVDGRHLKVSWRSKMGPSYSGPLVVGSRVFVTETRSKSHEVVRALDRKSGQQLWQAEWRGAMKVPFFAAANGSWIRSTPACDGKTLFVLGIRDLLVALDVASGEVRWRIDFMKKFRSPLPSFGAVCSPVLDGDYLYLQAGASVVKIEKKTGNVVWRLGGQAQKKSLFGSAMTSSAFSSPVIEKIDGQRQLLVQGRNALAGVDLESGKTLWSVKVPAFRGMNIQTPLAINGDLFTSSYGGGTFLFDVTRQGSQFDVNQRWKTTVQGYMSSPIEIDGHVYLHLRNQRFTCIEPKTGKTKWVTRPYGKYWSMVANGNRILALDERGDLLLIDANPKAFKAISTRHLSDSTTWAHLAVAGNQVVIRELDAISTYTWTP
tara:strand:- start:3550 stop:4800 length:1251 start_codon:yes stop_codon:yes gene_type:complete